MIFHGIMIILVFASTITCQTNTEMIKFRHYSIPIYINGKLINLIRLPKSIKERDVKETVLIQFVNESNEIYSFITLSPSTRKLLEKQVIKFIRSGDPSGTKTLFDYFTTDYGAILDKLDNWISAKGKVELIPMVMEHNIGRDFVHETKNANSIHELKMEIGNVNQQEEIKDIYSVGDTHIEKVTNINGKKYITNEGKAGGERLEGSLEPLTWCEEEEREEVWSKSKIFYKDGYLTDSFFNNESLGKQELDISDIKWYKTYSKFEYFQLFFHVYPTEMGKLDILGPFFVVKLNLLKVKCKSYYNNLDKGNSTIHIYNQVQPNGNKMDGETNKAIYIHDDSNEKRSALNNDMRFILQRIDHEDETHFGIDFKECHVQNIPPEYVKVFKSWNNLDKHFKLFPLIDGTTTIYNISNNGNINNNLIQSNINNTNDCMSFYCMIKTRSTAPLKKISDVISVFDMSKFGVDEEYSPEAFYINSRCNNSFYSIENGNISYQAVQYLKRLKHVVKTPEVSPLKLQATNILLGSFTEIINTDIGFFLFNFIQEFRRILRDDFNNNKFANSGHIINEIFVQHPDWRSTAIKILGFLACACSNKFNADNEFESGSANYLQQPLVFPSIRYFQNYRFYLPKNNLRSNIAWNVNPEEFRRVAGDIMYKLHKIRNANNYVEYLSDSHAEDVMYMTWNGLLLLVEQVSRVGYHWDSWKTYPVDELWTRPWILEELLMTNYTENVPLKDDEQNNDGTSYKTQPVVISFVTGGVFKLDREVENDEKYYRYFTAPHLLFVYRGSGTAKNWVADLMVNMVEDKFFGTGGKIQEGFQFLFEKTIKPQMDKYVKIIQARLKNRIMNYTVLFTGHSLGGVCAFLGGFYMANQLYISYGSRIVHILVIGFGTPSFGDDVFVDALKRSGIIMQHIITDVDPVPVILVSATDMKNRHKIPPITLSVSNLAKFQTRRFDGHMLLYEPGYLLSASERVSRFFRLFAMSFLIPVRSKFSDDIGIAHIHIYFCLLAILSRQVDESEVPFWSSYCVSLFVEMSSTSYRNPLYYNELIETTNRLFRS